MTLDLTRIVMWLKLALTRIAMWLVVSIVLYFTMLAVMKGDAVWTDYASLIVATALLFWLYVKALARAKAGLRS